MKVKVKTKIIASSPITSCQIDGETMKTVTDFIFLDFKITADGDCSHEIKKSLLLGISQFSAVTQSCPTLCDPRDCSLPSFPVHHQLPELAQTHVH